MATDYGQIELHQAKDLVVLAHIQRDARPERVRALRAMWDDAKVGILLVARITDGRYKGRLHVYDGGTRLRVKQEDDPTYIFPCWVKPMTETEAAGSFLSENKGSQKTGSFDNYKVGVRAGDEDALAIKRALDLANLMPDRTRSRYSDNGTPGEFSAFAAATRIVKTAHDRTGSWDDAGDTLFFTFRLGRLAYPMLDTSTRTSRAADGYDADIIQAIDRIAIGNPALVGDDEFEARLAVSIGSQSPGDWKLAAMEVGKNMPGSTHRGKLISKLIITHHNAGRCPVRFQLAGGMT